MKRLASYLSAVILVTLFSLPGQANALSLHYVITYFGGPPISPNSRFFADTGTLTSGNFPVTSLAAFHFGAIHFDGVPYFAMSPGDDSVTVDSRGEITQFVLDAEPKNSTDLRKIQLFSSPATYTVTNADGVIVQGAIYNLQQSPEPGSIALTVIGFAIFAMLAWRRRDEAPAA